jgi:hypothetical protein
MIDKSQWPERVRLNDFEKLIGVQKSTMQRRSMQDYFAERHKDAFGFYWLRDELTDEMLKKPHRAPKCPECASSMYNNASNHTKGVIYYRCTNTECNHRAQVNMATGVMTKTKTQHKLVGLQCLKCGGKLKNKSTTRGRQYSACVDCSTRHIRMIDTGELVLSLAHKKTLGVRCEKCESRMYIMGSQQRNGRRMNRYKCRNESCGNVYLLDPETNQRHEAGKVKRIRSANKPKAEKPKQEKAKVAKSASGIAREIREDIQQKNARGLVQPVVDKAAAARRAELREKQYQAELRKIERDFMGW